MTDFREAQISTRDRSKVNRTEFDRDINRLRDIFYDALERSIIFQKDVKVKLPEANSKEKDVLEAVLKTVDMHDMVFFSPAELMNKCLDVDGSVNLKRIRQVRYKLTKIVINIDNVIYRLHIDAPSSLGKQLDLLIHVFDGLGEVSRDQKNKIKLLRKKLRGMKVKPASPSLMVESLSKGRLFCMFFIKWLTATDNEYTDIGLSNLDYNSKRDFSIKFSQKFNRLSKTETYATTDFLLDKLDIMDRKIDLLFKESSSAHAIIVAEVFAIKEVSIKLSEQNPKEVLEFINSKSTELKTILSSIEKSLKTKDLGKSITASNWKDRLEHGIGITADIIQLITFISGIPSLPAFADTQTSKDIVNLFRELAHKIRG